MQRNRSSPVSRAPLDLILGLNAVAHAGGPGNYKVRVSNCDTGNAYLGSLSIVQTSKDTFKLKWNIGGNANTGYAIGDDRIMAARFTSDGTSGTALIVEDEAGGDKSVWAFNGEKRMGYELLTPKP